MKKSLNRCKHNALLQGLLRCAACNCGMSHSYTKKGSTLYRYYVCHKAQNQGWASCPSPSLPADQIEKVVTYQIRCRWSRPRRCSRYVGSESRSNPDDRRTTQERKERVGAGDPWSLRATEPSDRRRHKRIGLCRHPGSDSREGTTSIGDR